MVETNQSRHLYLFGACIFIYLLVFALFYPLSHGIDDEVGFINQSIVFSKGKLFASDSEPQSLMGLHNFTNRGWVTHRNLGRSAISAPFVRVFGLRSIFTVGALIQTLIAIFSALILVKHGLSPLWANLILWHPTLTLYSRTVMGDSAAGLGILIAFFFATDNKWRGAWTGLAVGCSALMRQHAGLLLPFFSLSYLISNRKNSRRNALECMAVGAFIGTLLLGTNYYFYGHILGAFKGVFGFKYILGNAAFYLGALLLIWPAMLLSHFIKTPVQKTSALIVFPIFIFFFPYYFHDSGTTPLYTATLGQRFLQVIIPVWIIQYAFALHQLLFKWKNNAWFKVLATGSVLTLMVLNSISFSIHQKHLQSFKTIQEEIFGQIPDGSRVYVGGVGMKYVGIQPSDGPSYEIIPITKDGIDKARESSHKFYALIVQKHNFDASDRIKKLQSTLQPIATNHPDLFIFQGN